MKMERNKMSLGLRYDVLKRDNFKCCVCGYGSLDNVKLHVDHIIPVSRGGKTKLDNLQTLCNRCNLGKSDKV
ncbi:MAG: HNH endonuclease [Bacilli bacterium]|nr:HNH endonuclease [Bacilli bacterium]